MSELSPEEEAEISRLLADAASPVTMPTDVSARLDDVLAGLVAERAEADEAEVLPIRSRRWPQVLVAAAAVALFGFVGANLMQAQQNADMATSGAADRLTPGDESAEAPEASGHKPPRAQPLPTAEPNLDSANDFLYAMKSKSLNGAIAQLSDVIDGSAGRNAGCAKWAATSAAKSYSVQLDRSRDAVVVLQRLNRSAARAYVYPCRQTVVPVSTALLLGLR